MIIRWCSLIKRLFLSSNILVQQNCSCESPIMCTCTEANEICYVLGDMNLLCAEGESMSELWCKMEVKAAGTLGMKPPEVHNLQCIPHIYFECT